MYTLSRCIIWLMAVLLAGCATTPHTIEITQPYPEDPTQRLAALHERSGAPPLIESRQWLDLSKWATMSLSLAGAAKDGDMLIVFFDVGERLPLPLERTANGYSETRHSLLSHFEIPFWTEAIVINESSDPINNASRPRVPQGMMVTWGTIPVHQVDEAEVAGDLRVTRYAVEYSIPNARAGDTVHLDWKLQGFFLDDAASRATRAGDDRLTNLAVVPHRWDNTVEVR